MKLAIFGTGGMGRELADMVARSPRLRSRYEHLVFVVDNPGDPVQGIPVVHPDTLEAGDEICFAIGSSADRRTLAARFSGRSFATLISDHAIVSPSARIGTGAIICDFAVINNSVEIGDHFLCNVFSQVSHDCVIGNYVTLSPRVSCNGWVRIDDDVFVGAGAVIRNGVSAQRLRIGQGATIGMSATVLKHIPSGATAIGTKLSIL
ncbi:NeuD/PglB/VioB family sugar acetyltransferase [Sphingomonas faeni]|uniref:NeuD/PglB/VioB family sugar acetyltransferase n=1 Tax=Sphingomonas faeni TaxID=185950 RepID=UPI00277EB543|nr:NeuD/PglB/VioB family sugar acetyltransferase [Sphingomonas faeni]MDQ0839820.1 sugar O-acyltransferase (sialic acid O-acetyltransferase NeuD family) [Sphingomonas faeni]